MFSFRVIILLGLGAFFHTSCSASDKELNDLLKDRICSSVISNITYLDGEYLHQINDDGSFKDIDYDSQALTNWPAYFHLLRVEEMSVAYYNNGTTSEEDLYPLIIKGLEFYYDKHPISDNWYWSAIAEPLRIGEILILMSRSEKNLPQELVDKLCTRWRNNENWAEDFTAANRTDVAKQNLYLGII